jgi:hypothetical protein
MSARQEERGIADPPPSADCPTFPLEQEAAELWGAMRGTVKLAPGTERRLAIHPCHGGL